METLWQVFDQIDERKAEMKAEIDPVDWEALENHFCFGGISYDETKRYSVPIKKLKGKGTRKYFCVWVTRTDHGTYEYGVNT